MADDEDRDVLREIIGPVMVQFQHVTGNGIEQFKDAKNPIVLWPDKYKDGDVQVPFEAGK